MNWFTRIIAAIFGIDKTINALKSLVKNNEKRIANLSSNLYMPVKQPGPDEMKRFNEELALVSKNSFFSFYLMAVETEMWAAIRDCPLEKVNDVSLQVRGGLQIIDRIRADLRRSESGVQNIIREENEPDVILSKIEQLMSSGKN